MTSELHPDGEFSPEGEHSFEFQLLLGFVRSKFISAQLKQRSVREARFHMYLISDEIPNALIGQFALADKTSARQLLRMDPGETLELGIPLTFERDGTPTPEMDGPENNYFVIFQHADGESRQIIINEESADELLFGDDPIVPDLLQKIDAYSIVPIRLSE
jgi:hypothetical protein